MVNVRPKMTLLGRRNNWVFKVDLVMRIGFLIVVVLAIIRSRW